MAKYKVPIEVKNEKHRFFGYSIWKYKLYADDEEKQYAKIKLLDIDGFVIGFHKPVKFTNIYAKASAQIKNSVLESSKEGLAFLGKKASIIEDNVSQILSSTKEKTSDIGQDLRLTAEVLTKETIKNTSSLFSKINSKFKKKNDQI